MSAIKWTAKLKVENFIVIEIDYYLHMHCLVYLHIMVKIPTPVDGT